MYSNSDFILDDFAVTRHHSNKIGFAVKERDLLGFSGIYSFLCKKNKCI